MHKPYAKAYLHSPAYSEECWEGMGNCDGIVPDGQYKGEECGCGCHREGLDMSTYAKVHRYHEEMKRYR